VARWTPDAAGRLQAAAFDLFEQQGFAAVSVGSIATQAGLTERTFFRHFATKEDVLFSDGPAILSQIVDAAKTAPSDSPPLLVLSAIGHRLGSMFEHQRAYHRLRTRLILSEPALHERDLLKQEQWSEAVAAELRQRGLSGERSAILAAATTAAFRTVYTGWCTDQVRTSLTTRFESALANLVTDFSQSPQGRQASRVRR
jgi:AcrR family transcriptional regulator